MEHINYKIMEAKRDPAVQKHLDLLQNSINRSNQNRISCKTWAITLVSAIMLLYFQNTSTDSVRLVYIPILLFFFMDCVSLGQVRGARSLQRQFVNKLNSGVDVSEDIYRDGLQDELVGWRRLFRASIRKLLYTLYAVVSFSTTVFYGSLALLVFFLTKQPVHP